jgi:hypothetical protein
MDYAKFSFRKTRLTISMAWVRQQRDHEELIFASDSRLSGDGRLFDSCPKILSLPRNDCAISFTGYTGDAFPMMLQLSLAIDAYNPAKRGELKLSALKEHALKVFDRMGETIISSVKPKQDISPSAEFLLGGYSWFRKRFQIWHIRYMPKLKTFTASSVPWVGFREEYKSIGWSYKETNDKVRRIGRIGIIGDEDQVKLARKMLSKKIKENAANGQFVLGMEPFEVVRDMLRHATQGGTIGGAPQVTTVHQFMQTSSIGVYWPNKANGGVFIQGRPTLGYENIDRYVLDPDTLELESPYSRIIPTHEEDLEVL